MLLRTIILYAILHVVLFLIERRRFKNSSYNIHYFIREGLFIKTQLVIFIDIVLVALGVIYLIAAFILWDIHLEALAAA